MREGGREGKGRDRGQLESKEEWREGGREEKLSIFPLVMLHVDLGSLGWKEQSADSNSVLDP